VAHSSRAHTPHCSVLLVALSQADINVLRQVGRNHLAELLNVLAVDLLGESKSSVDDTSVESEETLRNLVGTRVLGVETSDEYRLFAVVVELEVDAALGKDGALVFLESASDFGVRGGGDKAVFEDVAEGEIGAFDEGEEFGGAGVDVTV
jgi:hypothetical protein